MEPVTEDVGSDSLQILIVDDDEVDRLAVHQALQESDLRAQIEGADSLRGARAALGQREFSCLILDYHLRDGRALHLLRDEPPEKDLPPVIILTGSGNERIAVELMKAGAMDYLPKDELTPSRIAQSVRNALRVRASEEALRRAYDKLEERVAERTAELAAAYDQLEQQMASRRQAEDRARQHLEQLAHVARLSTLGEMAAGLAHELNQPLGAIANYANGCLERLDSGTEDLATFRRVFVHMAVQAERAGKIIHRLRTFVSTREPEMEPADLNQLLREVVLLAQPDLLQHGVRLDLRLDDDLPSVEVDGIQVQQVILNLVRNGMEAMEDTPAGERLLTLETSAEADGQVVVRVSDRGAGCEDEVLERIFEPFFTTKERGMGMGLAICRSIIEAHGGQLGAEAQPDGGLTVHFRLGRGRR